MWLIAIAWIFTYLSAWIFFIAAASRYAATLDSKLAMLFWMGVVGWCLVMGLLITLGMWQYSKRSE